MTTEPDVQGLTDVITLEGDDGHAYNCQIIHQFPFDGNDYALLLNLGEASFDPEQQDEDEGSIVVMRVTSRDDHMIFQTIESEDEFNRVVAHVEDMVREAEEEEGEEDDDG